MIDDATFAELLDDVGEEAMVSIIDTYLVDTERSAGEIEAAAVDGSEQLRRAAHALKGPSRMLGGLTLARVCQDLEEIGLGKRDDPSGPLLTQLAGELADFRNDLAQKQAALRKNRS